MILTAGNVVKDAKPLPDGQEGRRRGRVNCDTHSGEDFANLGFDVAKEVPLAYDDVSVVVAASDHAGRARKAAQPSLLIFVRG